MDKNELPSYEEHQNTQLCSENLSLSERLAREQERRVNEVIANYMKPCIETQIASGLFRTTFILVPSDVTLQGSAGFDQPSGYSRDGKQRTYKIVEDSLNAQEVQVLQLEGPKHVKSFWRQTEVVQRFGEELRSQWKVWDDTGSSPSTRTKRWFKKPASAANCILAGASSQAKCDERIRAAWDEVHLRRETEIGLYSTRTVEAVIVRVNLGGAIDVGAPRPIAKK